MAGSLIYVGTHAITPGKLEVAKGAGRELGAFLEANHPRMLHFEIYIDDDANEMTVLQIHPDEGLSPAAPQAGRSADRQGL